MTTNAEASLPPGFRFHPTDEELILHYLRKRTASLPCPAEIIAEVDIYKFDPWDLPAKTDFGDKEWYFFTPRDRKYPNGIRPNRAAASGYWKATGTDKPIVASTGPGAGRDKIGVKKALVFYRGKPPKGRKTSWIMHEYRMADRYLGNRNANLHFCRRPVQDKDTSMRLDDWVLCRIYKKTTGMQRTLTDQDQQQRPHGEEEQKEEIEGECSNNNVLGDSHFPTLPSSISQRSSSRLFKPPSLSELVQNGDMFSYLLSCNPPDQASGGFELGSRLGQHAYGAVHTPHVSNGSGSMDRNGIINNMPLVDQFHHSIPYQRESNHISMASRLGSSRQEDDAALVLNQSKDCNSGGPTSLNPHIFDNLKQPCINQNLLWNPHLGLH